MTTPSDHSFCPKEEVQSYYKVNLPLKSAAGSSPSSALNIQTNKTLSKRMPLCHLRTEG